MRARRRRRWRILLGLLAVFVAAAALGWYVWLPNHRPALRSGERWGIDVSHHQGEIDWGLVADDRIDFAYIKATEGGDFVDERFAANWMGAGSAGLRRGAYHFFTLCTPGAMQARHFLTVVPEDPDALPPAVDVELAENCADRPAGDDLRRELLAFLEIVESATGAQAVLYVGNDLEAQYGIRDELDRRLWLPRPLLRPDGDWWIWQASAFAHVNGVAGGVDLDVMRPSEPFDI